MSSEQESLSDPRDVTIRQQAETIQQQANRLKKLEDQVKRLQALLEGKADAKAAKKPVFKENYSLDRNKNKKKKPKRKSTGRKPTQNKRDLTTQTIDIYADGVAREQCIRHRSQLAWRIFDGQAVYVCYHVYDLPDSTSVPIPAGLRNSRSEFGIEIILILAFLHYWIGVSLDNARQIMNFFTGLNLSKGQADSLLSQLASDWNEQYDTIAQLIALQMIVYIDETGWKVGDKSCYTWVFSTSMHVLYRCGVSRKKTEATDILGESFGGIGVTDDYAAYQDLFSQHQLCWAHLIRKAIKLALQNPNEPQYAQFLDGLCSIYDDAKQLRDDALAEDASTVAIVMQLQDRILSLCNRREEKVITAKAAAKAEPAIEPTAEHAATFILLQRELSENVDCLFVFVEHPEVEPTNNRSERNVRREAEIRKGARTSKTARGAKRRGTIVTVLASLQTRLSNFTLANVLAEIDRWLKAGGSLFEKELQSLHRTIPPPESAR
ncbi:MAG: transposase [Gammaproteobacteria bacterium]|nr:transposase [Planctomycetaceae bacterium]MCP4981393.1 transposase [Gammaproteobacteria bacterium]